MGGRACPALRCAVPLPLPCCAWHPIPYQHATCPPCALVQAEHKAGGAVPDQLRAKGYVLSEEEAPKTKLDNPFDLLNLADE